MPNLKQYGLTQQQYDAMLAEQKGRCAICNEKADLVIDHDHEGGAVRGLLCYSCNIGLGFFKDRPVVLAAAAEYLDPFHKDPPVRKRKALGVMCKGSFQMVNTIQALSTGPGLHRCSVCDSARVKVERVARGVYMARAHYL